MSYDEAIEQIVKANGPIAAFRPGLYGVVELSEIGHLQFRGWDDMAWPIVEALTLIDVYKSDWQLAINPDYEDKLAV
jgi:hypothetical protein